MSGLKKFLILVVAIILALVGLALSLDLAQHWWAVHTGTYIPGSPDVYYNFWSGFGSDLGEVTLVSAVVAGLVAGYRKIECHDPKCHRIGHHDYEMNGATYKLCRVHHPAVDHENRPTREHFAAHHAAKTARKPRPRRTPAAK